jgi:hypothetical protein
VRAAGYYRPLNSDSRSEQAATSAIELYCREGFHTLAHVVGPGEPQLRDADQYGALVAYLDGLGRGEALVVIPGARHLSSTLDGFVERLAELDRVGGEVKCADPNLPDPFQNALETLPFAGQPPVQNRRVRESLMSKAARGEVLGRTPFGYVADMDGTFQIDPVEAVLVRRLFDMYAGGDTSPDQPDAVPAGGPGLRRIAGVFNGEGLRTRSGRPWTPITLSGMLRNRVYTGSYVRYGMRIASNHERIVERDVFTRAQTVMSSRSPQRKRRSLTPYILSGLARCWSCGRGMHGTERSRKWTRADGSTASRAYRYYACPSRSAGVVSEDEEAHPGWREPDLDRATLDVLRAESVDRLRASFNPPEDDSEGEELRAVEAQFLESVRLVATGRGGVGDLVSPLEELQTIRGMYAPEGVGGVSGSHAAFTFEDAMASIETAEPAGLHAAIASLVDRVIVHGDRVEPVFHAL